MIPNMYKIAGELTPFCMHVAARTRRDARAVDLRRPLRRDGLPPDRLRAARARARSRRRTTSPRSPTPRRSRRASRSCTSSTASAPRTRSRKIELLDRRRPARADRRRAASRRTARARSRPTTRCCAARPRTPTPSSRRARPCNRFYDAARDRRRRRWTASAELTGRRYQLFDYVGHPEAERVIVLMGSGAETAHETVELAGRRAARRSACSRCASSGRSRSPHFVAALPATVRAIAVLDRTKEPGALGEPLYLDVVTALREARDAGRARSPSEPLVIGGRYGLSSKEFTPAMVKAVFDELAEARRPRNHFTVGIVDDVTHPSLPVDPDFDIEPDGTCARRLLRPRRRRHGRRQQELDQDHRRGDRQLRAGLLRLRLEEVRRRSRSRTCASARGPIRSLLPDPPGQLRRLPPVRLPRPLRRARVRRARRRPSCSTRPTPPTRSGTSCRARSRSRSSRSSSRFYAIDAYKVAAATGHGRPHQHRSCRPASSRSPACCRASEAIAQIKKAIEKTYGKKGAEVVAQNFAAVDATLGAPARGRRARRASTRRRASCARPFPAAAPDFVQARAPR